MLCQDLLEYNDVLFWKKVVDFCLFTCHIYIFLKYVFLHNRYRWGEGRFMYFFFMKTFIWKQILWLKQQLKCENVDSFLPLGKSKCPLTWLHGHEAILAQVYKQQCCSSHIAMTDCTINKVAFYTLKLPVPGLVLQLLHWWNYIMSGIITLGYLAY